MLALFLRNENQRVMHTLHEDRASLQLCIFIRVSDYKGWLSCCIYWENVHMPNALDWIRSMFTALSVKLYHLAQEN